MGKFDAVLVALICVAIVAVLAASPQTTGLITTLGQTIVALVNNILVAPSNPASAYTTVPYQTPVTGSPSNVNS